MGGVDWCVCVATSVWVLNTRIGAHTGLGISLPSHQCTNRTEARHRDIATYLDGVDDRGGHAQAEEPLDGARAVHVVLLHEGAAVVVL